MFVSVGLAHSPPMGWPGVHLDLPILWSSHPPSLVAFLGLHRFSLYRSDLIQTVFPQELKRIVCFILSRASKGPTGSSTLSSPSASACLSSSSSPFSPTPGSTQLTCTSERIRKAMSVSSPMNTHSIGSSLLRWLLWCFSTLPLLLWPSLLHTDLQSSGMTLIQALELEFTLGCQESGVFTVPSCGTKEHPNSLQCARPRFFSLSQICIINKLTPGFLLGLIPATVVQQYVFNVINGLAGVFILVTTVLLNKNVVIHLPSHRSTNSSNSSRLTVNNKSKLTSSLGRRKGKVLGSKMIPSNWPLPRGPPKDWFCDCVFFETFLYLILAGKQLYGAFHAHLGPDKEEHQPHPQLQPAAGQRGHSEESKRSHHCGWKHNFKISRGRLPNWPLQWSYDFCWYLPQSKTGGKSNLKRVVDVIPLFQVKKSSGAARLRRQSSLEH